jgi:hypothetical protein
MPYSPDIQAKINQQMAEQRAKLQASYDADPKVKAAQDALQQAKDKLADEKTIQSDLDRDPRWHRWSAFQQNDVRAQMGTRVFDAENAVKEREQALDKAIGNHITEVRQAESDAARAEQDRLSKEAQNKFAAEQEATAKVAFRSNYLAAGGTDAQFEKTWPDIWSMELQRRSQGSYDAMSAKLVASGKYAML